MAKTSTAASASAASARFTQLLTEARQVLATPGTSPESSLYSQFESFFQDSFSRLGRTVQIFQQARTGDGIPDYRIEKNGHLIGWIELKAVINKDLTNLKGHDKDQHTRFVKGLSNVLYTNGWQWILYQDSKPIGGVNSVTPSDSFNPASLPFSPTQALLGALDAQLSTFADHTHIPFGTPSEAVEALATRAIAIKTALLEVGEANAGARISELFKDFKDLLFSSGKRFTWNNFVDSYVQIATFGVLLWRLESNTQISLQHQVTIQPGAHPLLHQALTILWAPATRPDILEPLLENLASTVNRVDLSLFKPSNSAATRHGVPDPIVHAYEPFFAKYDRAEREAKGVYYTPPAVVEHIVSGIDELLRTSMNRPDGVLDSNTTYLDPATGTGTFLLGLANEVAHSAQKQGLPSDLMVEKVLMDQVAAFELFPGPYTIAHQRLESTLKTLNVTPRKQLPIYLADTLAAPTAGTLGGSAFGVIGQQIVDERQKADDLKSKSDILVVFGNPPWDRLPANSEAFGPFAKGLLDVLLHATPAESRKNLKSSHDLFVAFWLWAMWVMQVPNIRQTSLSAPRIDTRTATGMIAFITNRTWILGDSLLGLRKLMHQGASEIWVTDLGGDSRNNFGAKSFGGGDDSVFNIRVGAAITWVIFGNTTGNPPKIYYRRLFGNKREKLKELTSPFSRGDFSVVSPNRNQTFTTSLWKNATLSNAPILEDLFEAPPLTGFQTARDTAKFSPLGLTADQVLTKQATVTGQGGTRAVRTQLGGSLGDWAQLAPTKRYEEWAKAAERRQANRKAPDPSSLDTQKLRRILYRPLDWRYVYDDRDWITWYRDDLHQIYSGGRSVPALVTIESNHGRGAAATHAHLLMEQHAFRGSAATRSVHTLYRPTASTGALEHNLSRQVLDWLDSIGRTGKYEAAYSYILAVLSAPAYTEENWQALTTDTLRVPLTLDVAKFDAGSQLGDQVRAIWEGTTAASSNFTWGGKPSSPLLGEPKWKDEVIVFDSGREISGVPWEVWDFEISGYRVVQQWLIARHESNVGVSLAREAQATLSSVVAINTLDPLLDTFYKSII